MLSNRVFLDNAAWCIATGMLGMSLRVRQKRRDITHKATRYERQFLFEVLEYLEGQGVPVEPDNPEVEAICVSFAEAVFDRARPTWQALFVTTSPKDWADAILAHPRGWLRQPAWRHHGRAAHALATASPASDPRIPGSGAGLGDRRLEAGQDLFLADPPR